MTSRVPKILFPASILGSNHILTIFLLDKVNLAIARFTEPLDKAGQCMPSGRVHMRVVLIGNILLVHRIRFDAFPIVTEAQNAQETAQKIGRELRSDLQHVRRIIGAEHHLALMAL